MRGLLPETGAGESVVELQLCQRWDQ